MVIPMYKMGRLILCLLCVVALAAPTVSQSLSIVVSDPGESEDLRDVTFEDRAPKPLPGDRRPRAMPVPDGRALNTYFFDDVETALTYTTGQDAGASDWQRRTLGAHSGSYSWDFGNGNYNDPITMTPAAGD
jgi:hypothetical protein